MGYDVKQMAELLRGGATMLSSTCPECGSILFKVNEDIICPKCKKKVIIVKDEQETEIIAVALLLDQVEKTVIQKISDIEKKLHNESDIKNLEKLARLLLVWLEILEKINSIKKK